MSDKSEACNNKTNHQLRRSAWQRQWLGLSIIIVIDFGKDEYEWKYCHFICETCGKTFDKKRGFTRHLLMEHAKESSNEELGARRITFSEDENPESDDVSDEPDDFEEESIFFVEVKENNINRDKCQKAKQIEIENFQHFKAYEEIPDEGQSVLGTRFVMTEKPDGSVKARLVVKGFQEENPQQSDSPTASREIFKVFCAISANEQWNIEASDVRSAFLQSEKLDRNIFVKPPPEFQKEGYIWRLLKPVYGLNDAARRWFQSTSEYLLSLGMKQSMGDNCLFYFRKDNKLEGLIVIHVDDYLSAGSDIFQKEIISKLRAKYNFGKISKNNLVYTGIQIQQDETSWTF